VATTSAWRSLRHLRKARLVLALRDGAWRSAGGSTAGGEHRVDRLRNGGGGDYWLHASPDDPEASGRGISALTASSVMKAHSLTFLRG